uniref:Uncharacterized protein n=1 Tax=Oryza sativa subsp. japonica TaxID=39947 RepID=Q67WK1_ORYSJ|nr:hypothetical protein [Oryza sativa Japonica Group]
MIDKLELAVGYTIKLGLSGALIDQLDRSIMVVDGVALAIALASSMRRGRRVDDGDGSYHRLRVHAGRRA